MFSMTQKCRQIGLPLEKTKGGMKNGQSRETGNIGYTRQKQTQHNMCWTPLYTNTNNVNKK
jgi:hypothetical protein